MIYKFLLLAFFFALYGNSYAIREPDRYELESEEDRQEYRRQRLQKKAKAITKLKERLKNKITNISYNFGVSDDTSFVMYSDTNKTFTTYIVPFIDGKKNGTVQFFNENNDLFEAHIFNKGLIKKKLTFNRGNVLDQEIIYLDSSMNSYDYVHYNIVKDYTDTLITDTVKTSIKKGLVFEMGSLRDDKIVSKKQIRYYDDDNIKSERIYSTDGYNEQKYTNEGKLDYILTVEQNKKLYKKSYQNTILTKLEIYHELNQTTQKIEDHIDKDFTGDVIRYDKDKKVISKDKYQNGKKAKGCLFW